MPLSRIRRALGGSSSALPLDAFRVLVGLCAFGYFAHVLREFALFSHPDGLIDHALIQRVYPYSRVGLFQSGLPVAALYAALAAAFAAAAGLVAGRRTKLCAGTVFFLAVSFARWNFPVMHVDDTVLALMALWLLFLPVGRTLVLSDWLSDPEGSFLRWKRVVVADGAAETLTWVIRLGYAVAAAWKLASPLWRDGFALYAALKLPFAYHSDFWAPDHLPWLRAAGLAALGMEALLPFLLSAPAGHAAKKAGLAFQLLLHGGILLTLPFPVANVLMAGSALLFFRRELSARLRCSDAPGDRTPPRAARLSAVLALVLALSVLRDVPVLGALSGPATALLWTAGVYENFRLFDWMDEKNVLPRPKITRRDGGSEVPFAEPELPSLRMAILAGYLAGDPAVGSLWIPIPFKDRGSVKNSLLFRAARRFCSRNADGDYTLWASLERVTPEDPAPPAGRPRFFMEASCRGGRAVLCRTYVAPGTRGLCGQDF